MAAEAVGKLCGFAVIHTVARQMIWCHSGLFESIRQSFSVSCQAAIVRVVTHCHLHVNRLSVQCSKWSFHWFIKGSIYFLAVSSIAGLLTQRPGRLVHRRLATKTTRLRLVFKGDLLTLKRSFFCFIHYHYYCSFGLDAPCDVKHW